MAFKVVPNIDTAGRQNCIKPQAHLPDTWPLQGSMGKASYPLLGYFRFRADRNSYGLLGGRGADKFRLLKVASGLRTLDEDVSDESMLSPFADTESRRNVVIDTGT